eukprot:5205115-Ditylum_brightwellii.AAC.1
MMNGNDVSSRAEGIESFWINGVAVSWSIINCIVGKIWTIEVMDQNGNVAGRYTGVHCRETGGNHHVKIVNVGSINGVSGSGGSKASSLFIKLSIAEGGSV